MVGEQQRLFKTKKIIMKEEPKQETRKEAIEKYGEEWNYFQHADNAFEDGIEWLEKQLCNSEIIQRIRATKSDAEARRIIKSI
jgi:hypothetical protein